MELRALLIAFVCLSSVKKVASFKKNVCKTYEGYADPDKSNDCYYSEEADILDVGRIIKVHGYPVELHSITTEDGFVCLIHRIPNPNPKGVILFQNPLTSDGIIWVTLGNKSLAFILYEEGYDIWIQSNRGTFTSNKHIFWNVEDYEFWDWTFHEIGVYDYATGTEYVSNKTNRTDLTLIGHSMSSTAQLVYATVRPDHIKKYVKLVIPMALPAIFKHLRAPGAHLSHIGANLLKRTVLNSKSSSLHITDTYNPIINYFFGWYCQKYPTNVLCARILSFAFGGQPGELDPAILAMALHKHPRSFSVKAMIHYIQLYNSGKFQMYDYGSTKNMNKYGSKNPPIYPIQNVSVPFHLMYSTADVMCTEKDHQYIFSLFPPEAKIYGLHRISGLSHIDFHFGKHKWKKVDYHIITLLRKVYP